MGDEMVKAAYCKFKREKAEFEGKSVSVDSDLEDADIKLGNMLRKDAPLLIKCEDCCCEDDQTIEWFTKNYPSVCHCPSESRAHVRIQRFLAAYQEAWDKWSQYYACSMKTKG